MDIASLLHVYFFVYPYRKKMKSIKFSNEI